MTGGGGLMMSLGRRVGWAGLGLDWAGGSPVSDGEV